MAFHDCRFAYANRAITHSGDLYLTNVQFVACSRPIYLQSSDHTITVDNALFHTNGMIFDNGHGTIFCGQHLTVQQAGSIAATSGSVDCSIYLTNCLIAGLTSWGKNVEDSNTNQVAWLTNGGGLFQSVAAGTHYLADNSPYRNVGTTNIGADLLAAIQQMTTYPPPVSTVDTKASGNAAARDGRRPMRICVTPPRLRVSTSDAAWRGLTGRCDMLQPMTCCTG